MTSKARTTLVAMTAAIVVFLLGAAIAGGNTAYADVGSIAVGEDVSYDKNGGMLSSMGFDTSKMPEDYDPDATTNPYGSDVSTLDEVDEIVLFDVPPERIDTNRPSTYLFGHDNKLNGSYEDFVSTCEGKQRIGFLSSQCFFDAVKCDITGDGRDSALAVVYTEYSGHPYNE